MVHRFFHLYRQFHFLSKIDCFSFLIIWPLLVPWYHFIVFFLVKWFLLLLDFFVVELYPPLSVVMSKVLLWVFAHHYCLTWYWLGLFLIKYLPWCLFSLNYIIIWSHSFITSNTILLVFHSTCIVLWSILDFHDLSKF